MRVLSWNVNGIRSLRQYHPWNETKDFQELIVQLGSDIVCFQEVKAITLPSEFNYVPGFDCFFHLCKDRAYSGVATLVKKPWTPVEVEFGFSGIPKKSKMGGYQELYSSFSQERLRELDKEGRVLISDHQFFVLFNVYFPAWTEDSRLEFKMDFSRAIQVRMESLIAMGRRVVLVGDVNVAHREIDHCDPQQSIKDHQIDSFGDLIPRKWFDQWLGKGQMIDSFRFVHPERLGAFTCWNTLINARPANYGTRIDYILVSTDLKEWIQGADVLQQIMGSDHCPVVIDFFDEVESKTLVDYFKNDLKKPAEGCTYYWNDYGGRQRKLDSFFKKKTISTSNTVIEKENHSLLSKTLRKEERVSKKSLHTITCTLEEFPEYNEQQFEAHFQSRKQWNELMASKPVPQCEHGEPAKLQRANKGTNKGKYFFSCARTVGIGKESRCDYFSWK
jgi:AP endonuclease-2